jgi:hypothetical protein
MGYAQQWAKQCIFIRVPLHPPPPAREVETAIQNEMTNVGGILLNAEEKRGLALVASIV